MFTKPDAIKVVCNASKIYHKKLANKNFLVLYKNRSNNAVESFEALFLPRLFALDRSYLHKPEKLLRFLQKMPLE